MIIPQTLKHGDLVEIISPSGVVANEVIEKAISLFEKWGLRVQTGKFAGGSNGIFSGTLFERLHDTQAAFDNPDVKAVFCARGGYGSVQYVDQLNLSGITDNPKWIVGFSDITVFHSLLNRNGIASIHAPMPLNYPDLLEDVADRSVDFLKQLLFQNRIAYQWYMDNIMVDCKVSGEIVGGNLSVLMGLRGTLFEPYYHGKILFLEDLSEYLYHIDRMMQNLRLGGVLNRVKGLLVGGFTKMKDSDIPFGKSVEQIITDVSNATGIPVFLNFPAGHQKPNYALPFGQLVTIESENGVCTLRN